MQRGIPKDEWGAVTTTYGDAAEAIGQFTGTERPRNARVLLLDANGIVDGSDVGLFFASWGPCPGDCPADFNGDGIVDGIDLGVVLESWGPCF